MGKEARYQVIISDKAKRMIGMHIRFMVQVSREAANNKKREIIAAMRSLEQMPERFPFFEGAYITPNKYHKMFVDKWYLILYQIQDNRVYVDYVIDCRRDYSWLAQS